MLKSDVENAQEFAQLMFDLTQGEGDSVEVHHPNPDFDGPYSTVCVRRDFSNGTYYSGDSVVSCLKQAKADMEGLG